MKKAVKIMSLALVVIIVGVMLVSCAKTLSGTYSGKGSLFGVVGGEISYKFAGSNVTIAVTAEVLGFSKTTEYKGKYEIKESDGKETITFTFEGDGSSFSGTYSFEEGKTESGAKTIIVGGSTFTKQ